LVAVTRRRWLLQALSGFPVAARVDSLSGVPGVALARLTECLAHTLQVQLSCLVVVDNVLDSSLASGSTTPHAAVSRRPCREGSKGRHLARREGMATIICVLYDDPRDGYPTSYARAELPAVERYYDGTTTPTPERIDFTPGELLGSVSASWGSGGSWRSGDTGWS
jgi:hypothetical protein